MAMTGIWVGWWIAGLMAGDPAALRGTEPMFVPLAPSSVVSQALAHKEVDSLIQIVDREKREGRGPRAAQALVQGLESNDRTVRWLAAHMLKRLGSDGEGAISSLAKAIHDSDQMVRWTAADALSQILPASAADVELILEALTDQDELVRWSAVQAVAKLGPRARKAAPILVELLGDDSVVVRREAARTLRSVFPQFPAVSSTSPASR